MWCRVLQFDVFKFFDKEIILSKLGRIKADIALKIYRYSPIIRYSQPCHPPRLLLSKMYKNLLSIKNINLQQKIMYFP